MQGTWEVSPEEAQEYFDALEDLRSSGEINMFGAPRWLMNTYGLDKAEARDIMRQWTESLNSEAS
jgi:hypothetical protein